MSYMLVFDAVLAALGIYLIYAAWKMKRTGEICGILVSDEEIKKCRDHQGFIDGIYRQMRIFGFIMMLFSVFDAVNGVMSFFGRYFVIAGALVFLAACLWFFRETGKVKEKFMS